MKYARLSFVLALVVLMVSPAILVMAENDSTPIALQPSWSKYSYWRFEGKRNGRSINFTQRFVAVETVDGERLLVIKEGSNQLYFTQELNFRFSKNQHGEILASATPAIAHFQWPLKIGQRWNQKISHTIRGKTYEYEQEFRVAKYERVRVPAGEFEAFKLIRTSFVGSNWLEEEYWYAAAVRGIVKKISSSSSIGELEFVLVAYELK